jgi:hypothetical protein
VRRELPLELRPPGQITLGSTGHVGSEATTAAATPEVNVIVIAGALAGPPEAGEGTRNPENDRH